VTTESVWIGGAWRDAAAPAGAFRGTDPATGAEIGPLFPISSAADVETCVAAAAACGPSLRAA
jgi:NADP-dependent aldehyde dehydrogenase